jgi:DNA-binding NarL/FixJ family response regulator
MPFVNGCAIYVVDDDKRFRSFVAAALQRAGYRTCEFASGDAALSATAEEQPSAVVLDVAMPGLNGYEVCRQLRELYGDALAILFVSGERTEGFDRSAGLIVGADDYLVKPVDPDELIARVRRLVDRPPSQSGEVGTTGRLQSLTPREHEILALLSSGYRQEEIANRLVISPKTVATHIQHILGKLEVRSRAQAIAFALHQEGGATRHLLA